MCHKIITNPTGVISLFVLIYRTASDDTWGRVVSVMVQMCEWIEGEPRVEDLLSDPISDLLLRHDGLTREDVWRAVESARRALAAAEDRASAAA
jgi:hypothetical protein